MTQTRVAVITGASSGIGKAVAIELAKTHSVVLAARRKEQLEQVQKEIEEAGGKAVTVVADVSSEQDVKKIFETAEKTYGRVDVVFNNAGFGADKPEQIGVPVAHTDFGYYKTVMAVNIDGPVLCTKYALQIMEKQGSGNIINNSSAAGMTVTPGLWAYSVSKHAVVTFTKLTALQYAEKGIRVNCICPGIVETEMVAKAEEMTGGQFVPSMVAGTPMKRPGSIQEIVDVVLFLASDKSKYMTGQIIGVDGGYAVK